MVQIVAYDMFAKAIKAGADNTTGDDPYLIANGTRYDRTVFKDITTGFTVGPFTHNGDTNTGPTDVRAVVGTNSINFQLWDKDSFDVDGFASFFEGGDDFIGQTTYFATGNEPLFIATNAQGSKFHAVLSGNGATYDFSFDVARLSGSTNGKLASAKGGIMQGSNKDGTLVGQGGKDIIFANKGDDLIVGGAGDDTLNGGQGDDLIFGGKGNDILSGGAGRDTFVVAPKYGLDKLKDFRKGEDLIGLGGGLTFEDISIVKGAGGTCIKAGSEQFVFLQGVQPSQLSAADFSTVDLGRLNSLVKHDITALKA